MARWKQAYQEGDDAALAGWPDPGVKPKLTPVMCRWGGQDRLLVTAVLTLAPCCIDTQFAVCENNITAPETKRFLGGLCRTAGAVRGEPAFARHMWDHAKYADLVKCVPEDLLGLDGAARMLLSPTPAGAGTESVLCRAGEDET